MEAFLARELPFLEIPTVVEDALDAFRARSPSSSSAPAGGEAQLGPDLATILETDAAVRRHARERLSRQADPSDQDPAGAGAASAAPAPR